MSCVCGCCDECESESECADEAAAPTCVWADRLSGCETERRAGRRAGLGTEALGA
jgi:hypothetical protein